MTKLPAAALAGAARPWAARRLCDGCLEEVTGTPASCQDGCSLRLDHAGLCDPRRENDQPCDRCGSTGRRLTRHEPQDDEEAASCLPSDIPGRIARLQGIAAGCSAGLGDGHCDHPDCPVCDLDRGRELAELAALAGTRFEVTYWVPTRYTVPLGAAAAAATLSRAGQRAAAATALRIARGEITEGDSACEPAGDQADLTGLASALHRANNELGIAGPNGEPGDGDDPDSYHVWVLPGSGQA